MAAKDGTGGLPSRWTPWSAFLFGLFLGTLIVLSLATIHWRVEANKHNRDIAGYNTTINAMQDQVEALEATLNKKDTSVVPIIKKLRPQLDISTAEHISKSIVKHSQEYRIPPQFVVHIINRESTFNQLAVSSAGAVGLMQVLPKYHKKEMAEMGISDNQLFHIDNNIRLGCRILRAYYNETGSIEKALTKYVGGNHKTYISDILEGFANEMIPNKEPQKKEQVNEQ